MSRPRTLGPRADHGLADAASGWRNEKVRWAMASYIDKIVVWPSTKTGVLRVNAALAGASRV
jgi:hypothetical protein